MQHSLMKVIIFNTALNQLITLSQTEPAESEAGAGVCERKCTLRVSRFNSVGLIHLQPVMDGKCIEFQNSSSECWVDCPLYSDIPIYERRINSGRVQSAIISVSAMIHLPMVLM